MSTDETDGTNEEHSSFTIHHPLYPFNPLTRLAVARCEFDRDAVLLRAGRMQALMVDAGLHDAESHYFLMLPSASPLARHVEHGFRRLPLGAQYIASGIA